MSMKTKNDELEENAHSFLMDNELNSDDKANSRLLAVLLSDNKGM